MMNSNTQYHVLIFINQKLEGLLLTLINGAFETVYTGNSEKLNIELPQGVYQLKARYIDYYQEYLLIIDSDKEFYFDLDYPSVAPVLTFKTTHEYLHGNAEHFSRVSTIDAATAPNFLFFGAKYYKEQLPNLKIENCLNEYSVYDKENSLLFEFNNTTCQFSNDNAWFAFSINLTPELYFLKWTKNSETRIFPFYIFENFQTQFFIRYNESADFDNCFFYYTNKMCFAHDAEEYLVLDKILFAYKDYSNYQLLTEKDKHIIQEQPYLVSLIYILQLLLEVKELDYKNYNYLQLPDLNLLSQHKEKSNHSILMPIISSVMSKYAISQKHNKLTFKPASIVDRTVDHIKYDLYWNNFSKIDETWEWVKIYSKFVQKSKLYPISSSDNSIIKASKSMANLVGKASSKTLQNRMNSLMGKVDSKNLQKEINNTMNSIGDVSKISEKLNVTATKVLRNYDIYKDIYDKMKQ